MEEERTADDYMFEDCWYLYFHPAPVSPCGSLCVSFCWLRFFIFFACFERKSLCERLIMFLLLSLPPSSSPRGHVGPEAPLQGEALHRRQGGGRRPGTLLYRASLARPLAQVMGS